MASELAKKIAHEITLTQSMVDFVSKGTVLDSHRLATIVDEALQSDANTALNALKAIVASVRGDYENPVLVSFGERKIDTNADVLRIAESVITPVKPGRH